MIGLIGEIGAGKSQVAAALAARGAFVIDADAVGHALLTQRPIRAVVVARFGNRVLAPAVAGEEPGIDRKTLGAIVFADPAEREALELIVHPWMRKTFDRAVARTVRRGQASAVVLDAAILLEAGWDSLCDLIVFVTAPRPQRVERLSAQRGWSEETLTARERAQWPLEQKRSRANATVTNDDGLDRLHAEVERFWTETLASARSTRVREWRAARAKRRSETS